MNVVFLGTPRPAAIALEGLIAAGHAITLVVTQPDRPAGRSSRPRPSPVREAAERHGLPCVQPLRVRDADFLAVLAAARPEVLVTVAYGRILPSPVLSAAPVGALNLHFSLLPRHRGAAPVQWALAHGDEATGVSTMFMNERLDEGDILLQEEIAIAPGEHAPELTERLAHLGAALLERTLVALRDRAVTRRPQDPALATLAPLLRTEDGHANLALPARAIEGRIRGFDPWPGVWTVSRGRRLKLARGAAAAGVSTVEPPGTVLELREDAVWVACGNGTVLQLFALQPEGRRILSARDVRNGRLLSAGESLESPTAAR